jgi:ABC-2 type transport system permease protein
MSRPKLRWLRKYRRTFEMGFQVALEYRINFAISLISAAYPIFIQTFLWTAIYHNSSESALFGYTYRQIIAYTFMAGLVARIVRTGFEYEIMDDVKTGKFSKFLVQPLGYFPYRLANFFGQKLISLAMILSLLAIMLVGLNVFWDISLQFSRIMAFLVTLALAMALNFLIFYCISSIAFWIVEIGFLFEGVRIVIILLSGGIFPLEVFGERFVKITNLLPFKYTVSYPINVLNGKLAASEIAPGLLIQCVWIAVCVVLANALWRVGSKRYVAVGG